MNHTTVLPAEKDAEFIELFEQLTVEQKAALYALLQAIVKADEDKGGAA